MFKKSQAWYTDFLIGLLILIMITFIFIRTIIDLNTREDKFQEFINDGTAISNALMSQGYCPTGNCLSDWNNLKGRVGFVKEGRIQLDKFNAFTQLVSTQEGYQKSRILLGTKNDYALYFEFNNNINNICTGDLSSYCHQFDQGQIECDAEPVCQYNDYDQWCQPRYANYCGTLTDENSCSAQSSCSWEPLIFEIISDIYGKVDDLNKINTKDLIKITRIIYYNLDNNGQATSEGRIVKMNLLVIGREK